MNILLITFLGLLALCITAAITSTKAPYGWRDTTAFIVAVVSGFGAAGFGIAYGIAAYGWQVAKHQTIIINREFGTNYTQEQVFWASNVIDEIRELDRKRVEVNGDVMRDQPDKKE